jgi:hypothetical protein
VIDQAPGRGDDDINALPKRTYLCTHRHAAKYRQGPDVDGRTVTRERIVNLDGEFPRWHQDQPTWPAGPCGAAIANEQALDHRQTEGGRLARPGLSPGHQIASGDDNRNALRLDRGGMDIADAAEWSTDHR